MCIAGCTREKKEEDKAAPAKQPTTMASTRPALANGERELFDGKSLKNWQTAEFGAHGDPLVKDGVLILPVGDPMTGVTWTGEAIPKINYEVTYECERLDGSDFFGTLTFPVNNSFASIVIGGWGGGVCGISSLDGGDAANNSTTTYRNFENKKWYKVRLRVTSSRLEAWLDGEQIVNVDTTGKTISTRSEVDLNKPFGFSSFQSTAGLRNIRIHPVDGPESKKQDF